MPTVDDLIDQLAVDDVDNYQYLIDNTLRIITVPSEGVILGVINDKDVNTVSFNMSRYYKELDLSGFSIRVYYLNANGEYGYFPVTKKTVSDESIDFDWVVGSGVAKYKGTVQFAVSLNIFDGEDVVQSFNTTIGEATVLDGLNPTEIITPDQAKDLIEQIAIEASERAAEAITAAIAKADTATDNANDAATKANTAAEKADTATDNANAAAEEARNAANTVAKKVWPHKSTNGRYDNASLLPFCESHTNDKFYGIMIPKANDVACVKFGAHADYAAPTPSTATTKSVDPYEDEEGPFWFIEANGGVDADGSPYVVNFDGDEEFTRSHVDEDTVIFRNVIWYKVSETDYYYNIAIRSTWAPGYEPENAAKISATELRPYILHAKYPLSKDSQGRMRSTSGLKPFTRSVSHNTLITQMATATSGKSGKNTADDWYLKLMFLMKYGTKNSQAYYTGCSSYTAQVYPTVAETGVSRVILSKTNAAKFYVGSSCMFGTHANTTSTDRNTAVNYNIFDGAKIIKMEEYDDNNTAVYFDVDGTFDTATTYLLSTAPWICGCCDEVDGDGSPNGAKNNADPFVIQGIEVMHGMTEIIGNVIISNSDATGWRIFVNFDSANEASSVTSNYVDLGILYQGYNAWKYPTTLVPVKGCLVPSNDYGGSASTGICDGFYLNNTSTTGTRELLSFGDLGNGSNAGLSYINGNVGLSGTWWYVGSRCSYVGRQSGVNAA